MVGYHLDLPGFAGGFVGVDLFFVISGFLISGSLAGEMDRSERIDFQRFWSRRVSRLVPHSVLMIATTLILIRLLPGGSEVGNADASARSALLYLSNLHFVSIAEGYFGELIARDPFLHTWSLGVEAQFYLLWPLVFAFAPKRFRVWTVAGLALISAAFCIAFSFVQPVPSFYTVPTRLWEFAAGGLIALTPPFRRGRRVGWIGLAMIALATVWFSGSTVFPGYAALLPVTGAALIMVSIQAGGMQSLGWKPLAALGPLSYGWYLWHWPLIVLAPLVSSHIAARAIAAALSLLIAWAAYRLLESPVRAWFNRKLSPTTVIAYGVGMSALVFVAASL